MTSGADWDVTTERNPSVGRDSLENTGSWMSPFAEPIRSGDEVDWFDRSEQFHIEVVF